MHKICTELSDALATAVTNDQGKFIIEASASANYGKYREISGICFQGNTANYQGTEGRKSI
jgi:hypothetical protein